MEDEKFREQGTELLNYIISYKNTLRSRRALPDVEPGFMRGLIPDRAPEDPDDWEDVLKDVERVIMPGVTHWQSPKFFAYYPTTSSNPSLLADLLCNAISSNGFSWASCPSCTELEVLMMDWLGQMLNLPPSFLFSGPGNGGGVIQSSASEATLMCLLSARTLFFKKEREKNPELTMGQLVDSLVAYSSDQAHSSVERAGLIGAVRMRKLETDEKGSLRGATLQAAILEDKAKGLVPFFIATVSGSTSSCAFDNLKELGPVCQEHGVWMHIDAAYAGSAFICPEFRPLLDGVEYATSFNFNPYMWMKMTYDCSALWVQDSDLLRCAFDVDPLYLKHENVGVMPDFRNSPCGVSGEPSPSSPPSRACARANQDQRQRDDSGGGGDGASLSDVGHWQIPLGRKFRSLKIWFVLRLFGLKKLQEDIRKDVRLAHELEAMVKSDVRFEIAADVILGLVCFRLKGLNEVSERLLRFLNADGKIHLVPSKLKDTFFLRLAICSPVCESADIGHAWDVIRKAADVVLTSQANQAP
ncbi:aromatic-L-amino-acid decarboxylase-like isoform X1 [Babylonia areolata]|uniref:aromatic-L-amino-acid decarboxylase-like isoform X1 n=1 Tax=Babylonia areolata TaxID=304850 RepID=UPI003FD04C12